MDRTTTPVPAPLRGTSRAGRALWADIVRRYELDEHELVLLRGATRTIDLLGQVDRVARRVGPILDGPVHPARVESRQLQLVLARLITSLRLPDEEGERPQRRGRARGTYRSPRGSLVELHRRDPS